MISQQNFKLVLYVILIIIFSTLSCWFVRSMDGNVTEDKGMDALIVSEEYTIIADDIEPTFDDLLDAIEWVESRGDANAMGDKYKIATYTKMGMAERLTILMLSDCNINREYTYKKISEDMFEEYEYKAIGAYQIHKIYVDECNRILRFMGGTGHYTYEDRWDKKKSRFMTNIVTARYAMRDWHDKRFDIMGYFETAARTHNNPTLRNDESTKPYWEKVKAKLETK